MEKSRFGDIDSKLEKLSKRLGAILTKDRPEYPQALRTFEERRIDWTQGKVRKAIIIQPTFEVTGVDSSRWNFINLAWHIDTQFSRKLKWRKTLVEQKAFGKIELVIDTLLEVSESNLISITVEDLE